MTLAYEPMLFARRRCGSSITKRGVDVARDVCKLVQFGSARCWSTGNPPRTPTSTPPISTAPAGPATFEPLPPAAAKATSYGTWQKEFSRWLQQEQVLSTPSTR